MLTLLALLIPLALPTAALGQGASATAPSIDLRAVAPATAFLVVSTDRFDAIRERASQNAWGRFFADERLGMGEILSAMLESTGAQDPWDQGYEVVESVHGAAAGFLAPVGDGKDFGGGVLVQPEEGLDVFMGHYDRLLAWAWEQEGTVRSSKTYGGVELEVLEDSTETGGCVVLFESHGVVGASAATKLDDALAIAYGMVDRISGQDPSGGFASNPEYVAARGTGKAPAIDVHLQIQEMLAAMDELDENGELDPDAKLAGVDKIRWAHLRADVGTGEVLEVSLSVHLPRGTFLGDLADLLGPLPTDLLDRLPGEGTSFALGNFDVAGLWREVKDFMAEVDPDGLKEMETGLEETSRQIDVDLEHLIQSFTGRFASFNMPVPAEEMPELAMFGGEPPEVMQQGGAFYVGMNDMDLARRTIEALLELGQMAPMVTTETFLGTTIHSVDIGYFKPNWALLADGVAISMYPTPLRTLLRQGAPDAGPSAADVPRFADTANSFGGASLLSFADTATSVQGLLGAVQMFSGMAFGMVEDPSRYKILSSPPDPEMATEFFKGTTVFGMRREGDVLELFAGAR